jgi:hypothetical protein
VAVITGDNVVDVVDVVIIIQPDFCACSFGCALCVAASAPRRRATGAIIFTPVVCAHGKRRRRCMNAITDVRQSRQYSRL